MDNQDKLIAAIESAEDLAESQTVAQERQNALEYYNGDPFGNEVQGRSQFVSRDVYSTVEWIKPSLLKMFAAGDEVVKFEPVGPEDVEASEQETDYINHIILQKNNGFLMFHDWFHDALVLKNAYVRAYYDKEEQLETERYQGLSEEEVILITQDPTVEIVGADQDEMGITLEVKRKTEYGCVKVENLPPEQCKVSHSCKSVDVADSDFFQFWDYKTISALRLDGFDVPDDINDGESSTYEQWLRDEEADSLNYGQEETQDPAMRHVKVRETWIRYDDNEDGKAELLHVVLVGANVLLKEEADVIPVACISPSPRPHRHNGMSVAESVMDLQLLKSQLIRGYLDNLYLSNNGRYAISDRVNLSDMLQSRPGGVVRVNSGDPAGAIMPLVHPQVGPAVLQGIEYADTVLENRTGVTRYNQGIDANSLNKTATGISQIMSASQQRIELIARIFAETGVKRLFWLVHRLTKQNSSKAEIVRLRNKWVPVDPRSWKTRNDLAIAVGLGTGNKDQMLMHLQTILMAQKEALQIGVATPKNIYEALKSLATNAGFKDSDKYFTDPANAPPQPPQPSPEEMKVQAQIQADQAKMQMDQQKMGAEMQLKRETAVADIQLERWKAEQQAQLEVFKAQLKAQTDAEIRRLQVEASVLTQPQED